LRAADPAVSEAAVMADLQARDARDSARAVAPLKPAPDAHLLDTTNLDIEAAFAAARAIVAARLGAPG
jgi:cytidylate kinase